MSKSPRKLTPDEDKKLEQWRHRLHETEEEMDALQKSKVPEHQDVASSSSNQQHTSQPHHSTVGLLTGGISCGSHEMVYDDFNIHNRPDVSLASPEDIGVDPRFVPSPSTEEEKWDQRMARASAGQKVHKKYKHEEEHPYQPSHDEFDTK